MHKEKANDIIKLLDILDEEAGITIKTVHTHNDEVHVVLEDESSKVEYYLTIEPRKMVA